MSGGKGLAAAFLTAAFLAASVADADAQSTFPSKTIEIAVNGGPGGGSDIFARTVGEIIQKHKFLPVPFVVVNKPGGGGAIALSYVAERTGDPHYWLANGSVIHSAKILGSSTIGYEDFTPLGVLAEDNILILVSADSPYKSIGDIVEYAKQNPGKLNYGGANVGANDHIMMHMLSKATGTELNFVSFASSAEALTAVLGGHVEITSGNPQEVIGQIEAKTVRVLAAAAEERLPFLPDVPTLKEEGIDVVLTQWRGLFGVKDLPEDVVSKVDEVLKELSETPEWQKYLQDNYLTASFSTSAELAAFLPEDYKSREEVLTELGMKKQ